MKNFLETVSVSIGAKGSITPKTLKIAGGILDATNAAKTAHHADNVYNTEMLKLNTYISRKRRG